MYKNAILYATFVWPNCSWSCFPKTDFHLPQLLGCCTANKITPVPTFSPGLSMWCVVPFQGEYRLSLIKPALKWWAVFSKQQRQRNPGHSFVALIGGFTDTAVLIGEVYDMLSYHCSSDWQECARCSFWPVGVSRSTGSCHSSSHIFPGRNTRWNGSRVITFIRMQSIIRHHG